MRTAIYCRVSSNRQERDGTSLDTQLESCREYSTRHGWEVVAEFQETFTGTLLWERPKLSALRELISAGKVDRILVHSADRLSRVSEDRSFLKVIAAKHGVSIHSVTEPEDDSLSARAFSAMAGLFAEYELVQKRERTNRGRKGRADSGRPISPSLPYGYRWVDPEPHKKTKMMVHEPEAAVVRRIFQALVDGATLHSIMNTLNGEGVPIPKPRKNGLNAWSTRTISRIVRNDAYLGKAWAYKSHSLYEGGKRTRLPDRPEEERIALPAGTIPVLVDVETWSKAQERIIRNRREATRNARNAALYLLRGGFAKCHHCGGTLEACIAPRGDRYYRCQPAQRRKHGCVSCSIKSEELEASVWEWVRTILEHPEVLEHHAASQASTDHTEEELASIETALVGFSEQVTNISHTISLTKDPDSAALLAAKLDHIAAQRRSLQARRRVLLDLQAAHERTKAMLRSLPQACERRRVEIENMTMGQRRDVLADLGVSVTVFPKDAPERFVIETAFDWATWLGFDPETGQLREDEDHEGMAVTVADWQRAMELAGGGIEEHHTDPER